MLQTHLFRHPIERLRLHQCHCLLDRMHQYICRNAAGQRIRRIDQLLAVIRQHMGGMDLPAQQIPLYLSGHPVPAPWMQCLKAVLVIVHDHCHIAYAVSRHCLEDGHSLADKLRRKLMGDLHPNHAGLSYSRRCDRNRVAVIQITPGNVVQQIIGCLYSQFRQCFGAFCANPLEVGDRLKKRIHVRDLLSCSRFISPPTFTSFPPAHEADTFPSVHSDSYSTHPRLPVSLSGKSRCPYNARPCSPPHRSPAAFPLRRIASPQ